MPYRPPPLPWPPAARFSRMSGACRAFGPASQLPGTSALSGAFGIRDGTWYDHPQYTVHADVGIPYPVDPTELEWLQCSTIGPGHVAYREFPPAVTPDHALHLLAAHFDNARNPPASGHRPDLIAACRRLESVLNIPTLYMNSAAHSWHLVIKMFYDLDCALFLGELGGRVNVRWDDFVETGGHSRDPMGAVLGVTRDRNARQPRVMIRLSLDTSSEVWASNGVSAQDHMIGNLIHEMIHAFFLVTTQQNPLRDIIEEADQDVHHGHHFVQAARLMENRTGLPVWKGHACIGSAANILEMVTWRSLHRELSRT
ncbi:hypothetical protein EJ03DRAFT_148136 [Teratosphaeria nubilosa]|uniref:SprT-like domain-containing protein n=1 Tax=Teratosphaeria nubilosa TaxID=161662 RepID=A0A6G1L3K2_9PEZI|nr:hypothetical protein EJ03DRAFT_148136 [Teratosphaeria nubilosa]